MTLSPYLSLTFLAFFMAYFVVIVYFWFWAMQNTSKLLKRMFERIKKINFQFFKKNN